MSQAVRPVRAEKSPIGLPSLHGADAAPIVCLSHLRWNFVFQRPQHLMTRFARRRQVLFWEEPVFVEEADASVSFSRCEATRVLVATPQLPNSLRPEARDGELRRLLHRSIADLGLQKPTVWLYTPMAMPLVRGLDHAALVYDCMDELANFKGAPAELAALERELLAAASVVFTGGYSLYEAKRERHPNVHPFPSSVDRAHFGQARQALPEPADQAGIARPRLGFFGVIDERMDTALLAALADARSDWNIVLVGPIVKIDPAEIPRRPNIHLLGQKSYTDLPAYLAGWDVALMPFSINEATRFISPTKTPEYLAGGKPVVSTPIADVVRTYGGLDGVQIADDPASFVAACGRALSLSRESAWLAPVDAALSELSWDATFARMDALLTQAAKPARARSGARARGAGKDYDYLIVGAGFAGSVLAERLASQLGKRVLLIDRRDHIGGNAYDVKDDAGLLIHRYGPHIFHTNSADILSYLSSFTAWRPYEHRVLAQIGDRQTPIPINRTTLNDLYGLGLSTDEEAAAFLASRAEPVAQIRTSEDVVVSAVGRELYETFFRGYTRKQWGLDPSDLDRSVTSRVPTRTSTDDRYFEDRFQCMPAQGYARLFENMLDSKRIDIALGVDFKDVRKDVSYDRLVYTGCIDAYFDYAFGPLPYRSLEFVHRTLDQEWFQPVAVVNHPSEGTPYTRVTEYKHLTGQTHPQTTICYEHPRAEGEPFYPIPRPENQALYKKYEALALREDVLFVGRLGTYRYYNMDQVVGQALAAFRRIVEKETGGRAQVHQASVA